MCWGQCGWSMAPNKMPKERSNWCVFLVVCLVVCGPACVWSVNGQTTVTTSNTLFSTEQAVVDFSGVSWWRIHASAQMCPWVVLFYSDTCGHCRRVVPTYSSFARSLEECHAEDPLRVATAAAVNCVAEMRLCDMYNVSLVPMFAFLVPSNSTTVSNGADPVATMEKKFILGRAVDVSMIRQEMRRMVKQSMWLDGPAIERCIDMRHALRTTKGMLNPHGSLASVPFVETTQLYASDIAGAFFFAMLHEVSMAGFDLPERLQALKKFLRLVEHALPGLEAGVLLGVLRSVEGDGASVTYWQRAVIAARIPFEGKPREVLWRTCRGSSPLYRGFPCGMWLLFHSITVNAGAHEDSLKIIQDFVRYFFSCEECRRHFVEFVFHPSEDPVLQLWRVHNSVNARLADVRGASDPFVPKRQFPGREMCVECYTLGGAFDLKAVAKYMRQRYEWDPDAIVKKDANIPLISPLRGLSGGATPLAGDNGRNNVLNERDGREDLIWLQIFLSGFVVFGIVMTWVLRFRKKYSLLNTTHRRKVIV